MGKVKQNSTKLKVEERGITLIALVITIIVLLILAGISITFLFGQNGLITRAMDASKNHKIAELQEKLEVEKGPVQLDTEGNTTIEKYLDHIVKEGIIDEDDIRETDYEKAKNIIVEDKYVFLVEEEEDGNIKITYEGEVKKLKPTLEIEISKITTNSITVKAKTNATKNAKYEYYIKDVTTGEEYKLKDTVKANEYTYTGLIQNREYQIKVKIKSSFGDDEKESGIIRTITLDKLVDGNINFSYNPEGWTNDEIIVTASENIPIQAGYRIQTSKDLVAWSDEKSQSFTEVGIMYARFFDGVNETNSVLATVTKIESVEPNATIATTPVTAEVGTKVTLEVTITDEGGSEVAPSSCKWVYLKDTKDNIGKNPASYTGGSFTSATQKVTLQTSTAGTYYLHVLCVDNAGNVKEVVSNAITITPPPTVEDLKAGNTINYYTTDGTLLKCAVLWDSTSTYGKDGIEIVTLNSVTEVFVNHLEITSTSGDPSDFGIPLIHNACQSFINTKYVTSARSVGSNPSAPTAEGQKFSYYGFDQHYGNDENYSIDYNQLKKLGINSSNKSYWLASRRVEGTNGSKCIAFVIRSAQADGNLTTYPDTTNLASNDTLTHQFMCTHHIRAATGKYEFSNYGSFTYGLRPVFKLKKGISIVKNSDGTFNLK